MWVDSFSGSAVDPLVVAGVVVGVSIRPQASPLSGGLIMTDGSVSGQCFHWMLCLERQSPMRGVLSHPHTTIPVRVTRMDQVFRNAGVPLWGGGTGF